MKMSFVSGHLEFSMGLGVSALEVFRDYFKPCQPLGRAAEPAAIVKHQVVGVL